MTIIIDRDEAIKLLKAAVERKGEDFIYNPGGNAGCSYSAETNRSSRVDDGPLYDENDKPNPGCLVGHVLYDLGVNLKSVHSGSLYSIIGHYENQKNNPLLADPNIQFTPAAVAAMGAAQTSQDNGTTWGRALEVAKSASDGKEK